MIATSRDGLAFTRLDRIAYDSADVPDAIVMPNGTVFLYFQGIQFPLQDVIMVGISGNGIDGWMFRPVLIEGMQGWRVRPCDPDVVYKDGVFRMYFTGDPTGDHIPETYSAVSDDGVVFTLESSPRFDGGGAPVLDPSLLWIGDTLHYFAGGASPDANWHAVSTDGLSFVKRADFAVNGLMMSNGIRTPAGYRFYGFQNRPPQNIQSIFSTDGSSWTHDPGVRLELDPSRPLEARYVKDPAIVLRDSVYIMYYVTRKPEFSGIEEHEAATGGRMELHPMYPSPADGPTMIAFDLPRSASIAIGIVDILGRTVAHLARAVMPQGRHAVSFDATKLPAGVYIVRLVSDETAVTTILRVLHR
jgi:hypothetical protein